MCSLAWVTDGRAPAEWKCAMYRLLLLPQSPGGLSIVRSSGRSWPLPRDWQVTCLWLPSRYHFTYPLPGPLGVRLPGLTVPGRMHSVSCRLWGAHVSPVTREEGSQVLAWGSQAALGGDDRTHLDPFLPSQNAHFEVTQALGRGLCTLDTCWRWWPRATLIPALFSLLLANLGAWSPEE